MDIFTIFSFNTDCINIFFEKSYFGVETKTGQVIQGSAVPFPSLNHSGSRILWQTMFLSLIPWLECQTVGSCHAITRCTYD